ncbi:protein of unknown function [Caldanaerobius fijiensis DSM 17918]|uniref:Uncharacterized protein n=1 Tax=Caldanaerobius fijiensis DSM 17918 TaxID=1121256 RepID=A0A1M5B6N1_9THEO|nr:protein of unknown function [Caldanaerobius fijiensis DSM 17918]
MQLECGLAEESYKYIAGKLVDFTRKKFDLVSGRRDWVAFQLMLKGDEEFTVSTGDNPTFSVKGPLLNIRVHVEVEGIPQSCIRLYPIGTVEDDDGIQKADMLLKNEVVTVAKDAVQPIWVEIDIPEDVQPGNHQGTISIFAHRMFEDEKKVAAMFFNVMVKDVVLPRPSEYRFHLDLWQHLSNIARKHEVRLWSDEHFRVLEEYVKSLAQLGQKAITIIASEIPWSGQRSYRVKDYPSDMFEYSMVKVEKDLNGNFIYDFSAVKRYIELCFKYGIDKEIEVFGLCNIWEDDEFGYGKVATDYPDAIRVRYYDRADSCYKYMRDAKDISAYIKALESFFIENGWIELVRIIADEPSDMELYEKRLEAIKNAAPQFKFKAAINHAEFIKRFKRQISDYVPMLPCVCQEWDSLKEMAGKDIERLLWYVCCWPLYPNTFISSPLLESRLIGLLTAYMNFDGFLRWNYTVWPEKPRERISFRYPEWRAGDTNFVYPGMDGAPILTIRYKNLKRGIEDYELIQMLKGVHPHSDEILSKVWSRIFKFKDIAELAPEAGKKPEELYSLDYEDYMAVKEYLLDEISQYKD